MINLEALDGAAILAAKIRMGLLGLVDPPHAHPSRWMWDRTRLTLNYAMQGYRVKSRRWNSLDLEIETPADAGNFKIGMELT